MRGTHKDGDASDRHQQQQQYQEQQQHINQHGNKPEDQT
jgi:hypothetical protein